MRAICCFIPGLFIRLKNHIAKGFEDKENKGDIRGSHVKRKKSMVAKVVKKESPPWQIVLENLITTMKVGDEEWE